MGLRFHVPRDRWLVIAAFAALILLAVAASAGAAESSRRGPRENRDSADAYVLARGDRSSSTNVQIEDLVRLKERQSGDFLWFRRSGRAYLIVDGAILAEAFRLFEGLDALEPELSALRRRERDLNERERALDREEDEVERLAESDEKKAEESDPAEPSAAHPDLDNRQREVESRRRQLESEQRRLEAVERKLDERQDELERAAEQRLWQLIDRTLREGGAAPEKP